MPEKFNRFEGQNRRPYYRKVKKSRKGVFHENDFSPFDFIPDFLIGQSRFLDPSQESCFAWFNDESPDGLLPSDPFRTEYAIINGTVFGKVDPCGGTQVRCNTDPGLVNSSIQSFSAYLALGSPAIDAGSNSVCPATDYLNNPRPKDGDGNGTAVCDLGPYEGVYVFKMTYLPLILKNY
jgi:hypothetical protein